MYNEKIENLISAALADGVLTEKEKQILFKNAQAQGIDLDEFEMILDARLVELEKAEKEKAAKSAPKSDKFGDVRKCPACGALVPALAPVCAECGYEFSGVSASSSSQTISKKISEIKERATLQKAEIANSGRYSTKASALEIYSPLEAAMKGVEKAAEKEIDSLIESFPIPNAKADLFDFILWLGSQFKNEELRYKNKYQECVNRANLLFPDDPLFKQVLNKTANDVKTKSVNSTASEIGIVIPLVVILIGLGVLYQTLGKGSPETLEEWLVLGSVIVGGIIIGQVAKYIYKKIKM